MTSSSLKFANPPLSTSSGRGEDWCIHVLDRAESDIQFVVQIEADVGRSEPNVKHSLIIRKSQHLMAKQVSCSSK